MGERLQPYLSKKIHSHLVKLREHTRIIVTKRVVPRFKPINHFPRTKLALIPGVSLFGQGGLTMLVERIKVDKVPTLRMGGKDCLKQEETPDADDGNNNTTKKKKLKLFCGVYSYDGQRDSIRLAALSYGSNAMVSLHLAPQLYPV
eukprot:scaffold4939_cov95-Skeletonema_dohrnii-CCMP3373.AAC.2